MAFVNKKHTIVLPSGEELTVPRLTIGRILTVTNNIAELVKAAKEEIPELLDLDSTVKNPAEIGTRILQAIPAMLPKVSQHIVSIVACYIDKEEGWVKDNLDLEDLTAIATPFFENILHQGNLVMSMINAKLTATDPIVSNKSADNSNKVPQS